MTDPLCGYASCRSLCPKHCLGDSASSFTMQQASTSSRDDESPSSGVSIPLLKAYSWSLTDPIKLLTSGRGISDNFKVQDVSLQLTVNLVRLSTWDETGVYLLVQLKWTPSFDRNDLEYSMMSNSLTARFTFFLHDYENEDLLYYKEDCFHRFVSNSSDLGFTIFVPLQLNSIQRIDGQNLKFPNYELRICFTSFQHKFKNLKPPNFEDVATVSLRSYGFRMLSIIASSLVYLFHFHTVRRLVQKLSSLTTVIEDSLIAAVEKTFTDMELVSSEGIRPGTGDGVVDIMNVFEAYGLALSDLDTIETCSDFLRELLARLSRYCDADEGANPLDGIFIGHYRHYTLGTCTRMRKFDCLYLDIISTDDIYQALNNACINNHEPPIQSSPNAGPNSRATEFHCFPSVLHLVLKRFKFDAMQRREIKLMTYFDIPNELEIDHTTFHAIAREASDNSSRSSMYKLFSVVVHEGTSGKNGHYMTYIRLDGQQWKRIASQTITVPDDHLKETASRSACFLTYIRQREWNQLIV
eukprot:g5778.t1